MRRGIDLFRVGHTAAAVTLPVTIAAAAVGRTTAIPPPCSVTSPSVDILCRAEDRFCDIVNPTAPFTTDIASLGFASYGPDRPDRCECSSDSPPPPGSAASVSFASSPPATIAQLVSRLNWTVVDDPQSLSICDCTAVVNPSFLANDDNDDEVNARPAEKLGVLGIVPWNKCSAGVDASSPISYCTVKVAVRRCSGTALRRPTATSERSSGIRDDSDFIGSSSHTQLPLSSSLVDRSTPSGTHVFLSPDTGSCRSWEAAQAEIRRIACYPLHNTRLLTSFQTTVPNLYSSDNSLLSQDTISVKNRFLASSLGIDADASAIKDPLSHSIGVEASEKERGDSQGLVSDWLSSPLALSTWVCDFSTTSPGNYTVCSCESPLPYPPSVVAPSAFWRPFDFSGDDNGYDSPIHDSSWPHLSAAFSPVVCGPESNVATLGWVRVVESTVPGEETFRETPEYDTPTKQPSSSDSVRRRRRLASSAASSCSTVDDCGSFENCIEGKCSGFEPDLTDTRLIRCVDGYRCDIVPGVIPGNGIRNDFQVIGISPAEKCGQTQPLPPRLSVFANSNRWRCESTGADNSYCAWSPGVGMRRNKTLSLEGLRLCGCPGWDADANGNRCDHESDFFVPLGKLGIQECLTNAHCLHKAFAYCVNSKCAGLVGVAASAGLKAYQCLVHRSCSVQAIATKALMEGLKVIPVASNFTCGAQQALDPEYFKESTLPCVMDVNSDGRCDIHLGIARAIGTNRLCGCNGQDHGGNGRPCDELADFDADLGVLTVQECVLDSDCAVGGVCVNTKCVQDTKAPFAVSITPANGTSVVPPVTSVTITFNENIQFAQAGGAGRRAVITTPDESIKFDIPVNSPVSSGDASEAHRVEIAARELTISPDIRMTTLPEGKYLLGFEGGIVEDLQGNGNVGSTDFWFAVSSNAGCPFLGVTGFTVDSINLNGVYRAGHPLNNHARWIAVQPGNAQTADALLANTIFWRPPFSSSEGRWVIGLNYDESKFLAYDWTTDSNAGTRPNNGTWKRWQQHSWLEQPDVIIACPSVRLTSPPMYLEIEPKPGARGIDPSNVSLYFSFDRPVTFGHWALLRVEEETGLQTFSFDPEDTEVRHSSLIRDLTDNRMIVKLPEPLLQGRTYQVTLETGVFTDLQYNPAPPIVAQDFTFTTFGANCLPLRTHGNVRVMDEIAGTEEFPHGAELRLACSVNYAPQLTTRQAQFFADRVRYGTTYPNLTYTTISTRCQDGEWDLPPLQCEATCAQYPSPGGQYEISVLVAATDDGVLPMEWDLDNARDYPFMKPGSQVLIRCADASEVLSGSSLGEVSTCSGGRWSDISLRCGSTCGPFPDLGPGYIVETPQNAAISIGATRKISCIADLNNTKTDTVTCRESGWDKPAIDCHYACAIIDKPGLLAEFGLVLKYDADDLPKKAAHGDTIYLTCAPGRLPTLATPEEDFSRKPFEDAFWSQYLPGVTFDEGAAETAAGCYEGSWIHASPVRCQRACTPFEPPGPGYNYSLIVGDGRHPGSIYEVSCRPDVTETRRANSPGSDPIVCVDGEWTRYRETILCFGSCPHPVSWFGSDYIVSDRGLRLSPPPSHQGIAYRHHQHRFRVECRKGTQPMAAAPTSNPGLLPAVEPIAGDVQPIPTLFEMPSQLVVCHDGNWWPSHMDSQTYPAGIVDLSVRALRCIPYCPPFPPVPSTRYHLDTVIHGTGWGSRRILECQSGFRGGYLERKSDISLAFVERNRANFTCHYGVWLAQGAPVPTGIIPERVWDNRTIAFSREGGPFAEDRWYGAFHALPCSAACSRASLDSLLNERGLQVSKIRSGKTLAHGSIGHVTCQQGFTRLTGPTTDQVGCSDGQWTTPLGVCTSTPTCSDGIRNGDEMGIDCGDSCNRTCPAPAACYPSGTCSRCTVLPSAGNDPGNLQSLFISVSGSPVNARHLPLPHGSLIHRHPVEDFTIPINSRGSYSVFECVDGKWIARGGPGSQSGPHQQLQSLRCSDKALSRGEWDVDCGGLCHETCPDCSDGIRNGNETWIDCGGVTCAGCRACGTSVPKRYRGSQYVVRPITAPVDLWSTSNVYEPDQIRVLSVSASPLADAASHAAQWRIECAKGYVSASGVGDGGSEPFVDIMCLDGQWIPLRYAVELVNTADSVTPEWSPHPVAFRCQHEAQVKAKNAAFHRFKPLPSGLPVSFCPSVTEKETSTGNTDNAPQVELSSHYCCDYLSVFLEELAGECGALLYSGNGARVEAFCQGTCHARLQQLASFYDRRRKEILEGDAALFTDVQRRDFARCGQLTTALLQITQELCTTNSEETSLRSANLTVGSALHEYASDYCFAQAPLALRHIRNLDIFNKPDELRIVCRVGSCFRSILRYFSALWELLENLKFQTTTLSTARRLEAERENNSASPLLHHFIEAADADEQLRWLQAAPRRLAAALTAVTKGRGSDGLGDALADPDSLRFRPSIIRLMCLSDAQGQPCTPYLRDLMTGVQALIDPGAAAAGPKTARSLGLAIGSLTSACTNTCILQISRHLGQELAEQGTELGDPYQRYLGSVLKMLGRYYCQVDREGRSCAANYFAPLLGGLQRGGLPTASHAVSLQRSSFNSCDLDACPFSYIGDGTCDPQCFFEACGFDGPDCFLAALFPALVSRLQGSFPLTDSCHPLNPDFSECPKHGECYSRFRGALLSQGCCFAVGVDILKELLDLEFFTHPLLRKGDSQIQTLYKLIFPTETSRLFTDAAMSLDVYEVYRPDRSSLYGQVLCNLFVDRTCSHGLARRVVSLEWTIDSLGYDTLHWLMPTAIRSHVAVLPFPAKSFNRAEFDDAVAASAPYVRFALLIRKLLADLFALAVGDIRDLRTWPHPSGATSVVVTIDAGLFTDEVYATATAAQGSRDLQATAAIAYQRWRANLPSILADYVVYMNHQAAQASAAGRNLLAKTKQADDTSDTGLNEDFRAMDVAPNVSISNVNIGLVPLEPIQAAASFAANYSGGDPLPPIPGSFDLGDAVLSQALCPLSLAPSTLGLDSLGTVAANLSLLQFTWSRVPQGIDGEVIQISCRDGYSGIRGQANEPLDVQELVCSNGRWISTDRREVMACHKGCPPFSLDELVGNGSLGVFQVSGSGLRYGDKRSISCSAGYEAVDGASSVQTLTCRDGFWDPLTLTCRRAPLFDGVCGNTDLDPLASEFKFALTDHFSSSSLKWWQATCKRGYQRARGSETLHLICADDKLLYAAIRIPTHVGQAYAQHQTAGLSSATMAQLQLKIANGLRQFIGEGLMMGDVAKVELSRLPWAQTLPLVESATSHENITLVCEESALLEPVLLEEQGIDDWVYIGLVAAMAFGVTVAFAAWGYYWQVRGRARHHRRKQARRAARETTARAAETTEENFDSSSSDRDDPQMSENENKLGPSSLTQAPLASSSTSLVQEYSHEHSSGPEIMTSVSGNEGVPLLHRKNPVPLPGDKDRRSWAMIPQSQQQLPPPPPPPHRGPIDGRPRGSGERDTGSHCSFYSEIEYYDRQE